MNIISHYRELSGPLVHPVELSSAGDEEDSILVLNEIVSLLCTPPKIGGDPLEICRLRGGPTLTHELYIGSLKTNLIYLNFRISTLLSSMGINFFINCTSFVVIGAALLFCVLPCPLFLTEREGDIFCALHRGALSNFFVGVDRVTAELCARGEVCSCSPKREVSQSDHIY